jgi:hypothetical protein
MVRSANHSGSERPKCSDGFADKVTEWVDRSNGKIRADVVHGRLVAVGYSSSERTTRRLVATLKAAYRHAHHRIYLLWIPEPGLWLQYDFGEDPRIDGQSSVMFCACLALSRFRIIFALTDRTMPSVIVALDQTFGLIGRTHLPAHQQREDGRRSPHRGHRRAQRCHGDASAY